MKKIWKILVDHWKVDFSLPYYLTVGLFLAAGLLLNLIFEIEPLIDRYNTTLIRPAGYLLLYGFAYYGGLAITAAFNKNVRPLITGKYMLMSLFGLVVLAVDSGFPYIGQVVAFFFDDARIYSLAYLVAGDALGFVDVLLPLFLIYPFIPRLRGEAYGLISPHYDVKPYFLLLLLMIPLITAASFTQGFISYYPTYKPNDAASVLNLAVWVPPAVYEFFYEMDFFNVELIFRGFMIVGLSKWLGKDAIIPMVTTYCFLHFGKPFGEAVSSIFGGYLLGVLAMYTRGIWGGVIIHMGIAGLMEIAAYLQKLHHIAP